MAQTVRCACGTEVPLTEDSSAAICPACGQPAAAAPVTPPVREIDPPAETAVPLFLRLLLDPTTIRRLLILGGVVSTLGLITWLVSLGLFDDPRVLAVSLGVGNLALLGAGWVTTLKTSHKLAGQALTFLGCVLAPLNLWFYDAQQLLTVEGHLWVGALVCSLLYVATVRVLRDPLFLYAVEAGGTLTALLLLGDLGRASDSLAVCSVLVGLAAISIHAPAAFSTTDPEFHRKRYGLPLFFSGQAQLALAMLGLLALQTVRWAAPGALPGLLPYHRIAATPWLAGLLWLTAAYLWLYSDLVVRKLGVYCYLAAMALMLAEATWLSDLLPVEALMVGLSLTSLAIRWVVGRMWMTQAASAGDSPLEPARAKWLGIAGGVGLIVAAVPCLIGLARHFHVASGGWVVRDIAPAPFALAWLVLGVSTAIQGWLQRTDRIGTERGRERLFGWHAWLAGVSLWLACTYGILTTGNEEFGLRVVAASLVVVAGACTAIRLPRTAGRPLAIATLWTGLFGFFLSVTTSRGFDLPELFVETHNALFASLLFTSWGIAWLALSQVGERRWTWRILGHFWIGAAVLKLFQWVDLPWEAYGPVLAALGVTLIAVGPHLRLTRTKNEDVAAKALEVKAAEDTWNPVVWMGDLSLLLGELIVFLRLGRAVFLPVFELSGADVLPALATAMLAATGACLAPIGAVRRWHGFATVCLLLTSGAWGLRALDLSDTQKVELAVTVFGLVLIAVGYQGRLREKNGERDPGTSLALWLGSLGAMGPVLLFTLGHRLFDREVSFGDELAVVSIGLVLLVTGCVLQVRSTSLLGAIGLSVYFVVLFAELVYRPQVAVGAWLAIGGGLVFLMGVALSVYRDRLLALPSRIANREGIFRVMDWR